MDHASQLARLRPDLLRFARLQLRDDAAAEDAVQETLLSALAAAADFAGRAQFKTWVFAILKNKLVDVLRRRRRDGVLEIEEIPEDSFDALFDERGHWAEGEAPSDWGDPARSLENARFWEVFHACLDHLPPQTGRVFMMREFLGFETEEICQELSISTSNCWVVLHRARMALRRCLEQKWFAEESRS